MEKAFEGTALEWALNWTTILNRADEIVEVILDTPNFYNEIVQYCASKTVYDVYLLLNSGELCRMDDINDVLNNM